MELQDLARHWTAFGEQDPLFAVLSDPSKKGGRWDLAEFFATGRGDIGVMARRAEELGLDVRGRAALDFGCGVGRLSQALADRYETVTGVDIAAPMIEQARRLNPYGERLRFEVNDRDDLSLFDDASFDLAYTIIVLQHMRPEYSTRYVREFLRVLRPGGLAVFQIPVGQIPPAQVPRLPEGGYAARIEVLEPAEPLVAGKPVTVRARITNEGTATWPAWPSDTLPLHVGNHWVSGGQAVALDDARASLTRDLPPGETDEVELLVTPPKAGALELQVDLVHEQISWFADLGSSPGSRTVQVAQRPFAERAAGRIRREIAARRPAAETTEAFEPVMETYAVAEDEVRRIVEEAGGTVVAADVDWSTGPLWASRLFFVRR